MTRHDRISAMYVREIHIKSFRHLEDVHLGPFNQPPDTSDLVVLAGPNGGGKSSILELLGFALSNSWSLSWVLRRSFPSYSFEVALGLTPYERELVQRYLKSSTSRYADDVLNFLDEGGVYFRSYNYTEGEYHKRPTLYNQIHSLVTDVLRNHYQRSLGFFLKSDRHYPVERFRRERIFEFDQMKQLQYIWNTAYNASDLQYKDMFEFLLQQRYHYFNQLGAHQHKVDKGEDAGDRPADPLEPYDKLLHRLFPEYGFAESSEAVPTDLYVLLPTGDTVPFSDLSSGEKEVFFILSFFLRHDVSNSVIVVDEPELHLHPELARLLIRTMQSIRPGNQIWLATHNSEIIDEAGRDRVIYIARDRASQKATITLATDETESMRQLKDFFGYSGYIGIAKSIVFLEGTDASSDRKIFASLFPEYGSKLKFVPAKTVENLTKLNAAILSILESNVGWMQFYLIRDRDYLPQNVVDTYIRHHSGRMCVLQRYHIENYLLDEGLIAQVQSDIFGMNRNAIQVGAKLSTLAKRISGEVLRDMVAFRLNLLYRPEDFSLGRYMQGQTIIDSNGQVKSDTLEQFGDYLKQQVTTINERLLERTKPDALDQLITECRQEVSHALNQNSDGWKILFPGRRLLEEYAKDEGLGKHPVLQNTLIKELGGVPERIPEELRNIISKIADGAKFSD